MSLYEPHRKEKGGAPITWSEFGSALATIVAGMISLSLGTLAMLIAVSLASEQNAAIPGLGTWLLAFFVAFGIPMIAAVWKYAPELPRVAFAMTWLPAVLNSLALLLTAQMVPTLMAKALQGTELIVARSLGDSHAMTRATSAMGHDLAEELSPETQRFPTTAPTKEIGKDWGSAVDIEIGREGNGVFVEVDLGGPRGSVKKNYLFDTGASYTTITRELANQLGIHVPDNAPSLEFNTAAGTRSSQMVYLPRLTVGKARLEGVLVSICDTCATDRYPGLLGINVMREFHINLDYQARHMQLIPRVYDGPPNRAYDIEPTVKLSIEGRPELWLRHVRWMTRIVNRGTMPIRDVIPRVEFSNGTVLLGQKIEVIEAGETGRSLVRGRVTSAGKEQVQFTLKLAQARW